MEQFVVFLQKNPFNLMLFFTAVVTGGMLLWPLVSRVGRPGKEVGPFEAVQLINRQDAVVIDVREAADFAKGHIANARNVPHAQVEQRLKELDKFKSKPVILSCQSGTRSASIEGVLRKHGFSEVFTLRGGIAAWQQASMPLEKK